MKRTRTVYLVIGLDKRDGFSLNLPKVRDDKPNLKSGEIAVKLRIEIPKEVFEEWTPEAVLEVPLEAVHRPPIQLHMEAPADSGEVGVMVTGPRGDEP